jgi:predicted dehydrogenase
VIPAAIVGLGRWGKSFVEAIQGKSARLRFARAIEPRADDMRDYAALHGLKLTADFGDALADPAIRAVVLATPHSLHREQVIAAARAGKQVFCEKPLALRLADARAMIAACHEAGVVLAVGHNRRFWPAMQELKRMVAAGELGQVLHIEGHNSNENSNRVTGGWRLSPEESPGGGMTGAGLHVLDAFIGLAGPVRRVHAQLTVRKAAVPPLDSVSAVYEFADGSSGLLASVRATPFYWRVHVFGTAGSAEVLGEHELVLRTSGAEPRRLQFAPADSLRAELEAFADAVEGRAPFPIPAEQMLATVAAFEATIGALQSGASVTLTREVGA